MKYKYLLLLFTIFCSHTYGQTVLPEFAPHGATWTYELIDYSSNPITGDHYLLPMTVLDLDTIVDGHTCRAFCMYGSTQFFAYRDSLQIWVHANTAGQQWQLLYDFGWTAGQVVNVPFSSGDRGPFFAMQMTVGNVSDTVINGDTLPMLEFQYGFPSKVIMNVGMTANYFIPQYAFIPEEGPPFVRCYSDTVLGSYKAPGVVVCDTDFHVGVPNISILNNLKLYPNPAGDEVHITGLNSNDISTVDLIAMDGRKGKTISSPNETILLDGLKEGIYMALIHLKDGKVVARKLTVQR